MIRVILDRNNHTAQAWQAWPDDDGDFFLIENNGVECGTIMDLWNIIKKDLSLESWKLKLINSGGGVCLHSLSEIWVDEHRCADPSMLLHEAAHVKHPDHGVLWGDWFTELVRRYGSFIVSAD